MTLAIEAQPIPLTETEDGALIVTGTRIPVDTIIYSFRRGDSAEQIADNYDSLRLADVYAILAFYLAHQRELDDYIQKREMASTETHRFIDTHFDQTSFRSRLLARQKNDKAGDYSGNKRRKATKAPA